MSRGPKSEIEKRNLGKEVIKLRLEGNMSHEAIAGQLGLKRQAVDRYLAKNASVLRNLCETSAMIELTIDLAKMHLGKNLAEAEEQYLRAKEEGDEVRAGAWHKSWQGAVDMLLKATGVYERAKREAEKADDVDNKLEIIVVGI